MVVWSAWDRYSFITIDQSTDPNQPLVVNSIFITIDQSTYPNQPLVVYSIIQQEDLENGEDVAQCPSCSLIVKVIYDPVSELFYHSKYRV